MKIQNNPTSFKSNKVVYKITTREPIKTSVGIFYNVVTNGASENKLTRYIIDFLSKKKGLAEEIGPISIRNIKKFLTDIATSVHEKNSNNIKNTTVINLMEKAAGDPVVYFYKEGAFANKPNMVKKGVSEFINPLKAISSAG